MSDLDQIGAAIRKFRDERDWMQFHNPKDMASAIAIEAAEMLELFLWKSGREANEIAELKRDRIAEEIADIAIYLIELAENMDVDLADAIKAKLKINAEKYPVKSARGSSKKYTEYSEDPSAT